MNHVPILAARQWLLHWAGEVGEAEGITEGEAGKSAADCKGTADHHRYNNHCRQGRSTPGRRAGGGSSAFPTSKQIDVYICLQAELRRCL